MNCNVMLLMYFKGDQNSHSAINSLKNIHANKVISGNILTQYCKCYMSEGGALQHRDKLLDLWRN